MQKYPSFGPYKGDSTYGDILEYKNIILTLTTTSEFWYGGKDFKRLIPQAV